MLPTSEKGQASGSFLKKRTKKLLLVWHSAWVGLRAYEQKFLLLFSKRSAFYACATPEIVSTLEASVRRAMSTHTGGMFVVGLCGAQGSGKSTTAAALRTRLSDRGIRTAVISIDDLYLSRSARETLADTTHKLLRTRGVPGTHDVALGERLLADLATAGTVAIPRFDKASDTGVSRSAWETQEGPLDVVIFEGWLVGARPETEAALVEPVNDLERREDADGTWRKWVNARLAGDYQRLFARLDMLVLIAAPSFDVVFDWRLEQEEKLRRASGPGKMGLMDATDLRRFVAHYQRLTEHILREMPHRADLVIYLDARRRVVRRRSAR